MTIQQAKVQLQPLLEGFLAGTLTDFEKLDFVNALKDFVSVPGATEAINVKMAFIHNVQQ